MPETASERREGDQKVPKKGGKLDKYKWWIIGALLLIGALVFYFVNKSKQNANQQNTPAGTPPGVDPNTNMPYASEYGDYGAGGYGGFGGYGGGGPGPPGPPGPRGPRGPRGRRWDDRDIIPRPFGPGGNRR